MIIILPLLCPRQPFGHTILASAHTYTRVEKANTHTAAYQNRTHWRQTMIVRDEFRYPFNDSSNLIHPRLTIFEKY